MRYFAKITADYWMPKNNLVKAVRSYIRSIERVSINDDNCMQSYIKLIRHNIQELHDQYPRCKPLQLEISPSNGDRQDVFISIPGCAQMYLYRVRDPKPKKSAS
jgi:hypothetical protein